MSTKVKINQILNNPKLRKELLVEAGLFLQHLEGIQTTKSQMEKAYDKIQKEKFYER